MTTAIIPLEEQNETKIGEILKGKIIESIEVHFRWIPNSYFIMNFQDGTRFRVDYTYIFGCQLLKDKLDDGEEEFEGDM